MAEFLSEAAASQAAFIIGFVKNVADRLARHRRLAVVDLAAFGKRCAVYLNDSCDVGAIFGKL